MSGILAHNSRSHFTRFSQLPERLDHDVYRDIASAINTGLDKPMATAIGFEIGIHNSTLAIFIALSVLGNFQLALPAAIYSVSMYLTASAFGLILLRLNSRSA